MIEEREIFASRFLKQVSEIRENAKLPESQFEGPLLVLLGIFCIGQKLARTSSLFSNSLIGEIADATSGNIRLGEREFSDLWSSILGKLKSKLRAESDSDYSLPFYAFNGIVGLLNASKGSGDSLLYIFDVIFSRIIADENPLDFRLSRKVSRLAYELALDPVDPCDYFLETGDLAVLLHTNKNGQKIMKAHQFFSELFLVQLRLALYGIEVHPQPKPEINSPGAASFVLVNHPYQETTSDGALRDDERPWDNSAIEAFDRMLGSQYKFKYALVIVPGQDRAANGVRLELRRHLVQQKMLAAVIDIPYHDKRKKRKGSVSAWLVSKIKRFDEVLCIDTARLVPIDKTTDSTGSMWFSGVLTKTWLNETDNEFEPTAHEGAQELAGLFLHEFRNGYKDVDTRCRVVSGNEIRSRGWALKAETYVHKEEGTTKPMLATIDSSPILDLLVPSHSRPVRAYVIGNNGEGKSLLLRELVGHLSEQGRRTIGLSFGTTDRFLFEKITKKKSKSKKTPLFMYLGARTARGGIAVRETNQSLANIAKMVHIDQDRLDVFNEITDLLGFRARHYFIPVDTELDPTQQTAEQLSEVILLSRDASVNRRAFELAESDAFKFGMVRQDMPGVVVFDELSSGEQQIIALATRLSAFASPGITALIDEPEISLHVSWQRAIPAILKLISEKLGCSVVVATHSPVIISSATVIGDHCFTAQQRQLRQLPLSQGQSVETVLFDGFMTYTENNRSVHETCAAIVADAIERLNLRRDAAISFEDLYDRLEKMMLVISRTSGSRSHRQSADLGLIDSARAAITEISSIQH